MGVLTASVREALRSLSGARLRTALGLIGIMIGIASVITMISTAQIATAESRRQFEALGTDILTIKKPGGEHARQGGPAIGLADALALAEALPSLAEAAPRIQSSGTFIHAGKRSGSGSVQGVTAAFASVNTLALAEGRFISDFDVRRFFCVVGARVARAMRRSGAGRVVGATLDVQGRLFTVVGVLREREESYGLPFQVEANRSVFVPITTARRMFPNSPVKLIVARMRPGVRHEAAASEVAGYFRARNPKLELEVKSAEQLIAQMESQLGLMTLLLGAVGSISLIVGGIGVMNIMLISVAERRREIGVRRALGARRRDIQSQFLIEAVILTVAGGIAGAVVGTAATWGVCRFTGWEFEVSVVSVISGIVVATAAGVFFGFQPAYQAARLDPIVALQGE